MNSRFQIATHILTLLHYVNGEIISSEYIAGSVNTNPALIRKELSNLRKHGLVESKEGKTGGYTLGRPAENIRLSDIYNAVKPSSSFGTTKNQPNPACGVGKQVNQHINNLYKDIDQNTVNYLAGISLQDFSKNFK